VKTRRLRRRGSDAHYRAHKERARALVHERLAYWSAHYECSYGRVAIRDQRTRWGSCSSKQNLNFNYRIVFLPPHLADYIIVHELCHLKVFNHSPTFWNLVAETAPNYKACRMELKKIVVKARKPTVLTFL
jgi:predicted metal-dependent hydrolase